jgi:N-acyl-L-homoserine lactone synthetase
MLDFHASRQHFTLVLADAAAVKECQRLRARVYCEELGFEPSPADGMERDGEDDRSDHVLVVRIRDARPMGCVRFIHPAPGRPVPALLHLPHDPADEARLRGAVGEFSRMAILPEARHRAGSQGVERCIGSLLAGGGICVFLQSRADVGVMACRPALGRLMVTRDGYPFRSSGPTAEYHGQRQLHWLDRSSLQAMAPEPFSVLMGIHASLYPSDDRDCGSFLARTS